MDPKKKCPHCESEDEWTNGWIPDRYGAMSYRKPVWIDGEPIDSWLYGDDFKWEAARQITAKRCNKCGYVILLAIKQLDK